MIKSIRLVNWRSHADSSLEFRDGTNLLMGIMGSGKSSVLEGISFALFGTFPALERRKLKLENLLRLNEPQAKVTLAFEWNAQEYRVERAIERTKKGTSSSAELYRGGAMVEHGPVAVTSYVEKLIHVDYGLFTRAIYSEQNNIDYFLTLDPRRRKEEIDALLGLDRFELARSSIVTVINQLRARRQALEGTFSPVRVAELEGKEKSQAEALAGMESQLAKARSELEKKSGAAEALSKESEALRRARESFERLSKEELRLSTQLESLQRELEGKPVDEAALVQLEERLRSLEGKRTEAAASIRAIDDRMRTLSREAGSLDARIKASAEAAARLPALEKELQSLLGGKTPEALSATQAALEQSLISMDSERKSLERGAAELSESLTKLSPGLSKCPLCDSSLTEGGIAHVREEKERAISERKARASELAGKAAQGRKDNESLLASIRRASVLSEKLSAMREEARASEPLKPKKEALDAELAKATDGRQAAQKAADSISADAEKARAEATSLRSLLSKKKEAGAVSVRLEAVRKSLSSIRFDEAAFEETRKKAEAARLETERLLASCKSVEAQLKLAGDMLGQVRGELASLRSSGKEIRRLSSLEEQLAIYKNALLDTQTSLRESLTEAINTAMNEIWPLLYPYRNYRALRLSVSDRDYVFEVDDGGGWRGLETIASGGERACAALALRVALAMVLTPDLSWLILDEPTHNLDAEAVGMLSSALRFRVPEVVRQTFVITHDEAFAGSEFASSYRLGRDKESNGETKIEAM